MTCVHACVKSINLHEHYLRVDVYLRSIINFLYSFHDSYSLLTTIIILINMQAGFFFRVILAVSAFGPDRTSFHIN